MVLKSDDRTGDFFRETGVSEDSSPTILASQRRRGQRGQRHSEFVKHGQLSEDTAQKSSVVSDYKCRDQTEKVMESNELSESDKKGEDSLQTSIGDDVSESNVVEEDVKVCDICGDAGLEDLLAVCSRCSDGAEHTYCMRQMLDKVPKGNWLCEECKYNEALEAQKLEHSKILGAEKNKSLGRTSFMSSNISSKLDRKDSFGERNKPKTVSLSKQLSLKRSIDNIEVGPTTKKQVIESSTSSSTPSSPSRVHALSKVSSLKNLEKSKGKSTKQYSTGSDSGGDSSENTRSPTRNSQGTFVKSNSFTSHTENNKGSEVVQKPNLIVDVKDGPGKLLGKSISSKSLGRSSFGEPKVKMLSPKWAPIQESKGQKQIRDLNSFEKKNSNKWDNSISVQTGPNSTKRLSQGDNITTSSISNSRDFKNVQVDGKLTCTSKQSSNASCKSPDTMASLGEVNRQSSMNIKGSRTSTYPEEKPSHASSKDGPTFNSSRDFDGSYGNDNHDNQSEKILDKPFVRSRQGDGSLVGGNRLVFSSDSSIMRGKDGVHEENKLKAAIEAAMQKRQHIVKKNKAPEKLSDLPMSNSQGNNVRDVMSEEIVSNHTLNSRQNISVSSEKNFKAIDVVSFEEDKFMASSVPEQEAVWQGVIEIHKNGKLHNFCGGFQAHLSSSVSDKVVKLVKKLPQKIVFNEVSRPSVWPSQFKEASVRDDNIALYFFAKDLESYLRSYKILLEYMMKYDLALRGNINGVELLIFPSNHLAQRLQRWNTLFFMWGVFRGRRTRYPDDRWRPLERPGISFSVSSTIPRIKDNTFSAFPSKNTNFQSLAVKDSSLSGNPTVNEDSYSRGCNVVGTRLASPISQVNLEEKSEKYSSVFYEDDCLEWGGADEEYCSHFEHQYSSQDGKRDDTKMNIANGKSDTSLKEEDGSKRIFNNDVDRIVENDDSILKKDEIESKGENKSKQEGFVDINVSVECSVDELHSSQCSPNGNSDHNSVFTSQKRSWMDPKSSLEVNNRESINEVIKGSNEFAKREIQRAPTSFNDRIDTQTLDVCSSSHIDKSRTSNTKSSEKCFFLAGSHAGQSIHLDENRIPDRFPDLNLALGVEKNQSRNGVFPFFSEIVDRKDPEGPPDIVSPKVDDENEDGSASLSLSLAFPFSDKGSPARA